MCVVWGVGGLFGSHGVTPTIVNSKDVGPTIPSRIPGIHNRSAEDMYEVSTLGVPLGYPLGVPPLGDLPGIPSGSGAAAGSGRVSLGPGTQPAAPVARLANGENFQLRNLLGGLGVLTGVSPGLPPGGSLGYPPGQRLRPMRMGLVDFHPNPLKCGKAGLGPHSKPEELSFMVIRLEF